MPTEKTTPASRRLAAILFADIAGYTAMMQSDEGRAMHKLRHYQTVLKSEVVAYKGEVIKNYGDGSLCLFSSVLDAVLCAKSLQETFSAEPKVPLRIGLHLGDVMYEENDIYGNALNIASRIESMATAGSILMSKEVYLKVKNQADLKFESLGSFDFKNVEEPIAVFALANKGLIVPDNLQLKGKGELITEQPKSNFFKPLTILGILLGLSILLLAYQNLVPTSIKSNNIEEGTIEDAMLSNKKSIAVLPFKNFSGDDAFEFFCLGMTEEVISRLGKINSLDRVPSLTSVIKYKDAEEGISGIAQDLEVNHILESSFQKAGDQIKIKLNLIAVATDQSLWSDEITGTWKSQDIFHIQAQVAENVAKNMDLKLSTSEMNSLLNPPTHNEEAYKLYLQAEYQRYKENQQAYRNAIPLYEKAIELDPSFVNVYESLSYIYMNGGLVWGLFPEEEAVTKSTEYLKKAIAIKPSETALKNLFAIEFYFNWNFQYCEQNLTEALSLTGGPEGNSTPDYLMKTSRYNQAIEWINVFHEKYPWSNYFYGHKAKALVLANRSEEANKILDIRDPMSNDNQFYLRESAMAHFYLGQYEASKERAKIIKTNFSDRAPIHIWLDVVHTYHDEEWAESEEYYKELLKKYEDKAGGSPAWFIAMYYFFIKDVDNGFKWLEQSYELHEVEMTWLKEELLLVPYRDNPRYIKIYNNMNWPIPIKG